MYVHIRMNVCMMYVCRNVCLSQCVCEALEGLRGPLHSLLHVAQWHRVGTSPHRGDMGEWAGPRQLGVIAGVGREAVGRPL